MFKPKKPSLGQSTPSSSQDHSPMKNSGNSSLVACPICERSIPEWFMNKHLDTECSGMEHVVENNNNLQPNGGQSDKRKYEDVDHDFSTSKEEEPIRQNQRRKSDQHFGYTLPVPTRNTSFSGSKSQSSSSSSFDTSPTTVTTASSSLPSQPMSMQAKKEKINNAVFRSMPLAERARPLTLEDYVGQVELVGPGSMLRALVQQDIVPSIILWGPCGVGKTTLARIIANSTKAQFKEMGATTHGVADVRKAFEDAKSLFNLTRQRTIVFLDEIHRFTKAQQDIFLPFVERGTITLIGATTENPSFRINGALLSRCRVLTLEKLSLKGGMDRMLMRAARIKWRDVVEQIRERILELATSGELNEFDQLYGGDNEDDVALMISLQVDQVLESGAIQWLVDLSDGDGRSAINTLEIGLMTLQTEIMEGTLEANETTARAILDRLRIAKLTQDKVKAAFQKTHLQYDRNGDEHYNLISALHKSIRGSDADAALYWLGRMLVSGEEPLYIARRLIRLASEDIGLADSGALPLAIATYQACQMIGMPECDVNLAHCVGYMARAKKSIEVYHAYNTVKETIQEEYAYPVPIHLRNAPTGLMKDLGYGAEYKYNPDYEGGIVDQEYLPKELKRRKFMGLKA